MFFFISFEYGEYLWSCNGKEFLYGMVVLWMVGVCGVSIGVCGIDEWIVFRMFIVLLIVGEEKVWIVKVNKVVVNLRY